MRRSGFIAALVCTTALCRCANPVTPTGGNKDITPPKLVLSNPTNRSTGVTPKIVVFKFDENIQVSNAKEQIIISPVPKNKPTITMGKNYIKIGFAENTLLENTTYSIQLNGCVKDLNENNQGVYSPYLFGTGQNLDTFSICGKCFFIEEPKTQKIKIKTIGLTPYISKPDKSMRFCLPGTPQDSIWVIAYNDLNGDNQWNKDEAVGIHFTNTRDTAFIPLYNNAQIKIDLIKYSKDRYGLYGKSLPFVFGGGLMRYKDTFSGDSAAIFSFIKTLDTNTFFVSKKPENKKDNFSYYWRKPSFLSDSLQEICFTGNKPMLAPSVKTIEYITKDKTINKAVLFADQRNVLKVKFNNNQTGNIGILFNFKTEEGTDIKDTFRTSIPVYTSLNITNRESFEIYINITNKNTGESYSNYIEPGHKKTLWVLSGDHDIFYFRDTNRNTMLDGPVIDDTNPIYGEYYKKLPLLKIKENLGVDLDIIDLEKP